MKATRLIRLRTRLLVCTGIGAAIIVGIGAYASAATADRKYTGCLKNGQISSVAVGGSPSAACATASVEITWNEAGPAGATGQQGATGARGATGPRGPQGPVEAVNAMKTGVPTLLTNHAGTGFDGQKLLFTTTTAGRLLVSKPLTAAFKCTEGGSLHFFLTVDGVAVRGSALPAQSRTNITDHQYMMLSGVTAKIVPAGNHTLGVGAMCNAGIQSGSGWSGVYSGTVVVVGG